MRNIYPRSILIVGALLFSPLIAFAVSMDASMLPGKIDKVAGATSSSAIGIKWAIPFTQDQFPITDYIVQYKKKSNLIYRTAIDGVSTNNSAVIKGLAPSTQYQVRVAAKNQNGRGLFSLPISLTTKAISGAISIDGICGSSSGGSFTTAPLSNLCSAGTPSSVTQSGNSYLWSCRGGAGGTTKQCRATKSGTVIVPPTLPPTPIPPSNPPPTPSENRVPVATILAPTAESITLLSGSGVSFQGSSVDPDGTITGHEWRSTSCSTGTILSNTASWTKSDFPIGTTVVFFRSKDNLGVWSTNCQKRTITVTQTPQATYTYTWSVGAWGNCSLSCGGGVQSRSVSCLRNDGQTVADALCSTTKPGTSQSCNIGVCAPSPTPSPQTNSDIVQYLTHDGDMVGDVDNSSAPSRDFWNSVLGFEWKNKGLGDWMDANGVSQGSTPYASISLPKTGTYSINVSELVKKWKKNSYNKGFYLRIRNNIFPVTFGGRTDPLDANRPKLIITTTDGKTTTLDARANATWNASTYRIVSSSASWRLIADQQPAILQFDLTSIASPISSATLRITDTYHEPGSTAANGIIDIFEANPPAFVVPDSVQNPELGAAASVSNFSSLSSQPGILFSDDFASPGPFDDGWSRTPERVLNPQTNTTYARASFVGGENDSASKKILAMKGASGYGGQGMDVQRDELYSQYYLFLENNFGSTIDGIKIPAMGTQFGWWNTANGGYWQMVTGNGGSPGTGLKVYNAAQGRWEYEGHSVRIVTSQRPADNSAYANLHSLNLYPYNLDQEGPFPAFEKMKYVALAKNKWYALDLYMKMNSLAGTRDSVGNYSVANPDGIYKVWVNGYKAFEKTNFRWRLHPEFGVEGFWLDFYHGGVQPAPYAMNYRIDRVSLATKYIGPMAKNGTPLPGITYTYSWSTGSWGNCSLSCGGGTRTRTVTCMRSDGTPASENNCTQTKPTLSESCNTQACTPTSTSGSCGSANGSTVSLYPSGSLACSSGIQGTVDQNGTDGVYNWTCSGSNGGITVSCAANKASAPPSGTPNAPSWVPASGRVARLAQSNGKITNTFASQVVPYYDAFYSAKIVNDYSTSVFNPYYGEYGSLVFYGGGHAATNDNSVIGLILGKDALTFKRFTNPTPLFGNTSASAGANSVDNGSSYIDNDLCEYTQDGQPVSVHSYGAGDIVGPENGGALYGSYYQVVCSAGSYLGFAGSEVAHKVDFSTYNGTVTSSSSPYRWVRVAKRSVPAGTNINSTLGAAVWSTYVPSQGRIYYVGRAVTNVQPIRWFDLSTSQYVVGNGVFQHDGDSPETGSMFFIPSRNIVIFADAKGGVLRIRYMDTSQSQPTWSNPITLSQSVPLPSDWNAALWNPDANNILIGNINNDPNAVFEIALPTNLSSPWTATRVPFVSGDTIEWAPAMNKKWSYITKAKAVVYMPYADKYGQEEVVYVYKPYSR